MIGFGTFKITKSVKYPSIPIYIDKTSTVDTLEGSFCCLLTGPEYIIAKQQGCNIEIKSAFLYPSDWEAHS